MLGVVGKKRAGEVEHLLDPCISDPVVDRPAILPRGDETAPAKAREVVRDLRLRQRETVDEVTNAQLALVAEEFEDPQPAGIA